MIFTRFTVDTKSADEFMDTLLREHREEIKEMLETAEHSPRLRMVREYHRRYFPITNIDHDEYQIGISYDKEEDTFLFFFQIVVNGIVNRIFCEIPEDFVRQHPLPYEKVLKEE